MKRYKGKHRVGVPQTFVHRFVGIDQGAADQFDRLALRVNERLTVKGFLPANQLALEIARELRRLNRESGGRVKV